MPQPGSADHHDATRERYLTQNPTHARLLALAKEWLGLDVLA